MNEDLNFVEIPLITVIMAAYNAEQYISDAINSVIDQTYTNWELIVVNDGSNDKTEAKILELKDLRIRYFSQVNLGVSAARNLALKNRKGSFFCMLDADDILPPNSLKVRLEKLLETPEAEFVDGTVIVKNSLLDKTLKKYYFSYYGDPTRSLVRLDGNCFFGPSWMIKIIPEKTYSFDETITHGEELMLYLSISKASVYTSVEEPVLIYRKTENSAMSNLKGLEKGYIKIFQAVKKLDYVDAADKSYMRARIKRIMFLSYLRKFDLLNSVGVLFRI